MNEDELYARAMSDANAGTVEAGLWAKAFALADGEPEKTKAKYIVLWVNSKLKEGLSAELSNIDNRVVSGTHQSTPACPACSSGESKLCSMVVAEGSFMGKTESSHISIGTGSGRRSGIGIELGSSGHHSLHQSQLSRKAARPEKPGRPVAQLLVDLKYEYNRLIKRDFLKGAIERSIEDIKSMLVQHERHDDWNVTRMCMQCGATFVPGKQNPVQRVNRIYEMLASQEEDEREEAYRQKIGL